MSGDGATGIGAIARAVDDLFWRYTQALDEGPLTEWPECFAVDATYQVMPRGNLDRGLPLATMRCDSQAMMRDRVYALESANFFAARRIRHVLGSVRIEPAAPAHDPDADADADSEPDPEADPDAEADSEAAARWTVRASFSVFETLSREPTHILAVGEYRGVVVPSGEHTGGREPEGQHLPAEIGALVFDELVVVNDTDLVPNSLVYPL